MSLGYWETLISLVGDGTALTAAARASMTQAQTGARYSLPANKLRLGDVLHLKASGRISSVITTPGTARFDISMAAGTAIIDSGAILLDTVAAHTNVVWELEIEGTIRAIGSGTIANIMWSGRWSSEDILGVPATAPKGVLVAMLPWNTPPVVSAGFDSTIANALDLNFTQTAATGSCQLHQLVLSLKTSTGF